MQYEIQLDRKAVGKVRFLHEGLYDKLFAQCEMQEGVYRLYLETENSFDSLGVLAPQNGMLTIQRRIPAGKYPINEKSVFLLSQTDPWQKYDGQLLHTSDSKIRSNSDRERLLLCEIIEPDQPLSLLPYFRDCRPYVLYGRQAILFEVTDEDRKRASAEF